MDIRLRILRRVIEIGESNEHHLYFDCSFCPITQRHILSVAVFDNESQLCDSYDKHGLDEETGVFGWLDEWGRIIREERRYDTD